MPRVRRTALTWTTIAGLALALACETACEDGAVATDASAGDTASVEEVHETAPVEEVLDATPLEDALDTAPVEDVLDAAPLEDTPSPSETTGDTSSSEACAADGVCDPACPTDPDCAPPEVAPHYAEGRTHSPITPWVAARLRAIASGGDGRADVFMKVGDSITADSNFMTCFAEGATLADPALAATRDFFLGADLGQGVTPFERVSAAAESGRTAAWVLGGEPSPVATELAAIQPSIALVMFGTNDIGWYEDFRATLRWYGEHMLELVDVLTEAHVVPILSSIPPIDGEPISGRRVPTFNALVRGLAEAEGVPFVDLHQALLPLPAHGLWPDGVHPRPAPAGACDFTDEGLQYGMNVRNLLSLEALDRARRALASEAPPDPAESAWRQGAGTSGDPFVIAALPYADQRDTRASLVRERDGYTSCDSGQDESGPEVVYRLTLGAETPLRALVVDRPGVDVDLHLLDATGAAEACLRRDDTAISATLPAGSYTLVVDTYVSSGVEEAGAYLLVVVACEPGDPDCAGAP